jgi:hypothetical protein
LNEKMKVTSLARVVHIGDGAEPTSSLLFIELFLGSYFPPYFNIP